MFFGEVACFVSSSVELKKQFQKPTLHKKEDVQRAIEFYNALRNITKKYYTLALRISKYSRAGCQRTATGRRECRVMVKPVYI